MSEIIKDHKELAKIIEGKTVLLLNSLGKDSAAIIEWCVNYAKLKKIIAINYKFISEHPDDKRYLEYQKSKYPSVEFISAPNPHELNNIISGAYQNPFEMLQVINGFEYYRFTMEDYNNELLKKYNADYICIGTAKYEGFARAVTFHQKGILRGNKIYPIGMMTKEEIINIIKALDIKLHPCYKLAQSTFDTPSYYKMRAAFIANPEYYKSVLKAFPLLALDKYRYEILFKRRKK